MDYLVRGPRLPRAGGTLEGIDFREAPGGEGANQAVAAARIDARAVLVSRIGSDPCGQMLRSRLDNEGVNTRYFVESATEMTGAAVILVGQPSEKQILVVQGAKIDELAGVKPIPAPAPAVQRPRSFVRIMRSITVPLRR